MHTAWDKVEQVIKHDGIAIVPTDTIYGILGSAFSKKTVERIYRLKGRDENKPFIILISDFKELEKFGVKKYSYFTENIKKWIGVSIVFECNQKKFEYLHRGSRSIAFRLVGKKHGHLYNLIKKVGPLVAPSANPQGLPPAKNRKEARKYFGENVDAYVCYGSRFGKPSTIVKFESDIIKIIREGSKKIKAD